MRSSASLRSCSCCISAREGALEVGVIRFHEGTVDCCN